MTYTDNTRIVFRSHLEKSTGEVGETQHYIDLMVGFYNRELFCLVVGQEMLIRSTSFPKKAKLSMTYHLRNSIHSILLLPLSFHRGGYLYSQVFVRFSLPANYILIVMFFICLFNSVALFKTCVRLFFFVTIQTVENPISLFGQVTGMIQSKS